MDWTDENINENHGQPCFWKKMTIDCDEHICRNRLWSCGDGQCILWHQRLVFQNFLSQNIGCLNLRNLNYMCELTSIMQGWTLANGLCWFFDDGYNDTL